VRSAFHHQIDLLTADLGRMCELAGLAMERATQALLQADLLLAEQVITDHDELLGLRVDVEREVVALLALQSPVATDLRIVVSGLQNAAGAERMGALALHVAKIARRRHPDHAVPQEVSEIFAEMGRIAVQLGHSAKTAILSGDPIQAARIGDEDDAMDERHRHLFSVLMNRQWTYGVAAAIDLTLLGRFYERFADQAVEIGRRVFYQVTGEHPAS
jgi:phosphate transport system protein